MSEVDPSSASDPVGETLASNPPGSHGYLELVLQHLPANVWTTDRNFRVTSCLGGGLASVGVDATNLIGACLEERLRDHPRHDEILSLHRRAIEGETLVFESKWSDRDLFVRIQPLRDATGETIGCVGMTFDTTDQKRAEKRYRELFERNLGTRQLYWSASDRDDVIDSLRKRGELRNFEIRLRTRDGHMVWGLLNEALVPNEGDDILEGTIIDITPRKLAEQRIEYQTFHDSLTDLPNRFLFNDRLRVALAHARRHSGSVAVMFLDLDHFKLINDTMAHSASDELLRRVSERLSACIRPDDTVARVGGDEFVFIFSDIRQTAASATIAQKIIDAIRRPFVIHGRELYMTASIGIAVAPHDGNDEETLVKNADSAMFRAKEAGRDTFQFHTQAAQLRAEARLTTETALRHALDRQEFFLVYQPQVEIESGKITGFEALLRWQRPGHGVIAPDDFIPLAEETGAIVAVGEWVLRSACAQLREWQRLQPDLRMAINISPRQFQQDDLTRVVEDALEEHDLDPSTIELEITESLSMGESDLTIGRLSHFRSMGLRVALDDFGTGYSSLGRLRYLPIDSIKIDRTFVVDLREQGPEHRIVQAIITMARSLDLRVIAEGVETESQQTILQNLGCNELQGFIFSKPLPSDQATRLLM
jgi:diguanylate cyclase (GGDEF)-like protein